MTQTEPTYNAPRWRDNKPELEYKGTYKTCGVEFDLWHGPAEEGCDSEAGGPWLIAIWGNELGAQRHAHQGVVAKWKDSNPDASTAALMEAHIRTISNTLTLKRGCRAARGAGE